MMAVERGGGPWNALLAALLVGVFVLSPLSPARAEASTVDRAPRVLGGNNVSSTMTGTLASNVTAPFSIGETVSLTGFRVLAAASSSAQTIRLQAADGTVLSSVSLPAHPAGWVGADEIGPVKLEPGQYSLFSSGPVVNTGPANRSGVVSAVGTASSGGISYSSSVSSVGFRMILAPGPIDVQPVSLPMGSLFGVFLFMSAQTMLALFWVIRNEGRGFRG